MLVTYRPEYRGALDRLPSSHRIALAPLDDSESAGACCRALGCRCFGGHAHRPDRRQGRRQSILRRGDRPRSRRAWRSRGNSWCVCVPTKLGGRAMYLPRFRPRSRLASTGSQATSKRTLNAAAVIGLRFEAGLLASLRGHRRGRELLQSGTHRPGGVHSPSRLRIPASADSQRWHTNPSCARIVPGCIRASPTRSEDAGVDRRQRRAHRRASRGGGRSRGRLRLAHASWSVRGVHGISALRERAGSGHVRSPTSFPPTNPTERPSGSCPGRCCAPTPGEIGEVRSTRRSLSSTNCVLAQVTTRHGPSAWRASSRHTSSRTGSKRLRGSRPTSWSCWK